MGATITGPLFDGRAAAAVDAYTLQVEDDLAKTGKAMILQRFGAVLQHPTGHYEALITTDRVDDAARVTDDGHCLYGPWLEGIGSRNYPKTVFRGYFTFRLVGQQLRARSGGIAAITLPPFLARME